MNTDVEWIQRIRAMPRNADLTLSEAQELVALIQNGDLIHVDEACALWVEDAAPAVAAE